MLIDASMREIYCPIESIVSMMDGSLFSKSTYKGYRWDGETNKFFHWYSYVSPMKNEVTLVFHMKQYMLGFIVFALYLSYAKHS